MSWGQARRPKISNKLGIPTPREGSDGDIQVRQTNLGAKLFGKLGGRWKSTFLSDENEVIGTSGTKIGMDSSGAFTVDQILLNGKITLTSTGTQNVCIGTSNKDLGSNNISIGVDAGAALASGIENICIGTQAGEAIATTHGSTYIGYKAGLLANSTGNIAIGAYSGSVLTSSGAFNTYIGYKTRASATNAINEAVFAGGDDGSTLTTGKGDNTVVLGSDSVTDIYMSEDSGATVHCGGIKIVGDGKQYFYDTGDEWMYASSGGTLYLSAGTSMFFTAQSVSLGWDGSQFYPSNNEQTLLGIDSNEWEQVWSAGGHLQTSDQRLKTNIQDFNISALDKINDLKPRTFDWKKHKADDGNLLDKGSSIGFIAQEVQDVIPEMVSEGTGIAEYTDENDNVLIEKGSKSLGMVTSGSILTAYFVKSIQELSAKVDTMQTEINNLK